MTLLGTREYIQLDLSPGTYELLLEHWDGFWVKGRHEIEIEGDRAIFGVFNRPTSTQVRKLDSLPSGFTGHFTLHPAYSDW